MGTATTDDSPARQLDEMKEDSLSCYPWIQKSVSTDTSVTLRSLSVSETSDVSHEHNISSHSAGSTISSIDERDRLIEELTPHDENAFLRLQMLLQREDLTTTEQVNTLYAMGRLATKMCLFEKAMELHQAELELTEELVEEAGSPLGYEALAKVVQGMGKIARDGMGDNEVALDYFRAQFAIEVAIWRNVMKDCMNCSDCGVRKCRRHRNEIKEATIAVEGTRRRIGRLIFEQDGDINRAMEFSLAKLKC